MSLKQAVTATLALMLAVSCLALAGEKATDLMSLALKNKAAGKTKLAIEQLQKAVENSPTALQKNLALFMLGDCEIESGRYSQAAKTYEELRSSVSGSEEKAEATYRLLQAETFLKNRKKATRLYREIQKNYRSSPYYELAKAFVAAQKLVETAPSEPSPKTPAKQQVATVTQIKKPSAGTVKESPAPKPASTIVKGEEKKKIPPAKKAPAGNSSKSLTRVSPQDAALLQEALSLSTAPNKEEIVGEVLALQDKLKQASHGKDEILFQLAEKTLEFGETLEACKLFDQLLNQHPTSPYVEQAYYEAIRLRAILGVYEAVTSWAKAFLGTFPASKYSPQVKALLNYSQHNGQLDFSTAAPATKKTVAAKVQDQSSSLEADSNYVQATRKMKDGKYNLALLDLKNLSRKYPAASKIWWDLALVYVQFEDFPNAEQAIKKMLAITPDNEEGNSLLGYIHYRLEDYQQAASAYDKAGEAQGNGVNFFDPQKAAQRMKKSGNTGK